MRCWTLFIRVSATEHGSKAGIVFKDGATRDFLWSCIPYPPWVPYTLTKFILLLGEPLMRRSTLKGQRLVAVFLAGSFIPPFDMMIIVTTKDIE